MSQIKSTTLCNCEKQTMTFLHLDQLANELLDAIEERVLDFDKKAEFIREREQRVFESGEMLLAVNETRDTLVVRTTEIETKLQEYNDELLDAELMLHHLEHQTGALPNWSAYEKVAGTEKAQLLNLLAASELSTAEFNLLTEEFADFNERIEAEKSSAELICSIMAAHVDALAHTENQLHELQDKINEIMIFAELKEKSDTCGKDTGSF